MQPRLGYAVHPRNMIATTAITGTPELPRRLSLDEARSADRETTDPMPTRKKPTTEPPLNRPLRAPTSSQDFSSLYEITRVSPDGTVVDLCLVHTSLERFRVPVAGLKFLK